MSASYFSVTGIFLLIFVIAALLPFGRPEQERVDFRVVTDLQFSKIIGESEYVLALFYKENCESCASILEKLQVIRETSPIIGLDIIQTSSEKKAADYAIKKTPSLVFFRKAYPIIYDDDSYDVEAILDWIQQNREIHTRNLDDDSFEHLTQTASGATTGDWLVMFYHSKCNQYLATLETAASKIKHQKNIAKVDISAAPKLEGRFKVTRCPTILYFRLGNMYVYNKKEIDVPSVVSFTGGWYKNLKAEKVPVEPSPFDSLTDNIAVYLKEVMEGPNGKYVTITGCTAVLLFLWLASGLCSPAKKKKYQ